MPESKPVKRILIVGGGTAGWMVAAKLSQHFRKTDIRIQLVESSEIGTVGVGEATIPTIRRFYASLGFTDAQVMSATQATVKLGIEFRDWHRQGESFIHPFGVFGQPAHGIPFHHFWLRGRELGEGQPLSDYCLGIAMAQAGRFAPPPEKPRSALAVFDWALHFDAGRFAALMRDYAESNGVVRVDARISDVELDPESGEIAQLHLQGGLSLSADLYIDCSGFQGLLIEQALNTGYEDWSQWLLCDSALAVQSERTGEPAPRTVAKAHQAGWQWQIPLQERQGNGHVYCCAFMERDTAEQTLRSHIDGKLLHEPRPFRFTAGRRRRAWNKNCIAVGLAAGFIEPLESTSIALVETAIEKICGSFPHPYYGEAEIERFNRVTAEEYTHIRDFIILHYKANQRSDSDFWQHCRNMAIPDSLEERLAAYREQAMLHRRPWEIFHPDSWLAIYSGFDCYPRVYNKRVQEVPTEVLKRNLERMRQTVAKVVSQLPPHGEFLRAVCPSDVRK
ncbi:tryptophan halogenase family protein [Microbulbifer sp. ALW1]|uniref:tryptophan halogenase family protein n=1 Tax=Microbulbifer sp. (strain ALW1) TaxID=1516059 RepID=UPI00135CE3AE|nr:tryptophan halogenase family protein [Microbulbifer sp. ALW1]